jgi:hypothetical protein
MAVVAAAIARVNNATRFERNESLPMGKCLQF